MWLLLLLAGCTSPAKKIDSTAVEYQLEAKTISASARSSLNDEALHLPIRIYVTPGSIDDTAGEYALVFFEGDGRPWRRSGPRHDPNTRDSVALPLMVNIEHNPSAYIHRPCYGFTKMPQACDASWWTSARYSQAVVSLLSDSIDQLQDDWGNKKLVLVGHSGGGALSVLIAAERDDVAAVVTLAGNLNHSEWTTRFNYLPLTGSRNADEVMMPHDVLRWHLLARKDQVIPLDISLTAIEKDPRANVFIYDGFDHACCWVSVWPEIYQQLMQALHSE